MIKSISSTRYILDTNILINLNDWLPVDKFPKFWDRMEKSLKDDKWVLLDVVVAEILKYKGKDNISNWCKKQKVSGFVKITNHLLYRSVEINDKYKIIDEVAQKSTADPIILAFAEQNKSDYKIFTREGYKKDGEKLMKIPDVCRDMNIKYLRQVSEFYEHIEFFEE